MLRPSRRGDGAVARSRLRKCARKDDDDAAEAASAELTRELAYSLPRTPRGRWGGEGGGAKRVSLPHRQCRAPTSSCRANPRAAPTPRHLVSWSYHTVTSQGRPNAAHCCRARLHPPSSRPRRPRQAPTRRTYSHAKSRRGRSPQKGARPEGGRTRSALRLSSARHCRRRARAKLGARRGGGRR